MRSGFNRRSVLRGTMAGAAVTVGLPLLDCFLNGNGTALASGAPLPVRFGTWFWGLGVTESRWAPKKIGAGYDVSAELRPIEAYKDSVNVLSGFNVLLDGRTPFCHYTGHFSNLTGIAPKSRDQIEGPTFDTAIAAHIGSGSRFRSLEITCSGNPSDSYSRTGPATTNPGEISPVALYQRIFGPEFQDPNAASFTPDPGIMMRKSVISAVGEEHKALMAKLGASDRQRMEQYLTALRQTENQLALQLQKPPPAEACVPSKSNPSESIPSTDVEAVRTNHGLFADLAAMALACNQTRVVNLVFSASGASTRKPGSSRMHHTLTHEELFDAKLGYQPECTWFVEQSMAAWGTYVGALAKFKEGAGTLLDNCLIFAHSDTNYAKIHSLTGIPMMIAGKAGGKIKSGMHIAGNGDPVTRAGLTIQQVFGLPIDSFGGFSMKTQKTITEIMV